MEREEILFRTLERYLIADRRLENHLELLFVENGLRYARTAVTENKAKPDFLFPGVAEYHNPAYDSLKLTSKGFAGEVNAGVDVDDFLLFSLLVQNRRKSRVGLAMLGVKFTCKDRWRQVLAEADRIDNKHLLTLETSISTH